jgi:hypothetical protein
LLEIYENCAIDSRIYEKKVDILLIKNQFLLVLVVPILGLGEADLAISNH